MYSCQLSRVSDSRARQSLLDQLQYEDHPFCLPTFHIMVQWAEIIFCRFADSLNKST